MHTSTWIARALIGGLSLLALSRGWFKTGGVLVLLGGVMLAMTDLGPHIQHGTQTGVDGVISTVQAFFH